MIRLLILSLTACGAWAADETPQWVRTAVAASHSTYVSRTPAVVLWNEEVLTVDSEGKRVMQERGAIKRLNNDRFSVSAGRTYDMRSGRIRDIRAWTINPDGKEIRYGKDRIKEGTVADARDYSELRYKTISPADDVKVGGVFAYEIVEEEKTVFTQYLFRFQSSLPVVDARFVLNLPPGWEVSGHVFNADDKQPSVSGNSHTWALHDLPWIDREPHMPGRYLIAPRLAVTYYPSDGRAGLRPLSSWPAVSNWLTDLSSRQAEVTPAIQAKADQLTANASNELEKIRAIAAFVQKTAYVSIQLNLTRGGGYVPHKADQVLTRNYGDCKDKANLMKALLKAAGIESHMVTIFSGARDYVRKEWPSTMQFNHAIIAVKVQPATVVPTVLAHNELGNLLFFDPTDPYTPVGDISEDEQGSLALVVAGDRGALVQVPLLPASANRIESKTVATMNARGGIDAKVFSQFYGQNASEVRGLMRETDSELRKFFEAILTLKMGGLTLKTVKPEDHSQDGHLDLTLEFSALQIGRMMQDRLLVLSPGALLSTPGYNLPNKPRTHPVRIKAEMTKDTVTVETPAGFAADEIPDAVSLVSPYGTYQAQWKVEGRNVEFTQSLELKDALAPVGDYPKVREFFSRIAGAANASVVLVRK